MNKPRILIVDDDPNLSNLTRLVLEKTQRFEVRVENRSAHALSAALDFMPDMLLLDVDMPGKDGGEVEREIRQEPRLAEVAILFLTSLISSSETAENTCVRGGKSYLGKPFNPKILLDTMDRMMTAQRSYAA